MYGTCNNNSVKTSTDCTVRYIPYPKPTTLLGLERAKKWIINCNRQGMALENINEDTYVCSQHFVDPRGPTNSNPDPVPAVTTTCQSSMRMMKKAEHVCNKKWTDKLHMAQMKCIQDTARDTMEHSQPNPVEIERHYSPQQVQTLTATQEKIVPANPGKEREHQGRYESSRNVPIMSTASTTSPQASMIATLHEVMLHCKEWYMKYELENDSQITAYLVKWVECRTLITVTVVAKRETLHVSLMVDNVQVDRKHQLWSETTVENLQGIRKFLDNLSTWNICIHLRSQNDRRQTDSQNPTTCKVLIQPPSVICTACATKCKVPAANSKRCAKPSKMPRSLFGLQHRHMDKTSLCFKINYLTKRNACYRKQISRLKSRLNSYDRFQ